MKKSRLVQILKTFSKKEVRDLRKWLQSPAHNTRDDVLELFEYLVATDHLEQEEKLDKAAAFSTIFDPEPYDDARMRQIMHFLLKSTEDFLIYNELLRDEVRAQTALARVFRLRQLDKSFQRTIQVAQKQHEHQPLRDRHYHSNHFQLQNEQYFYLSGLRRTVPLNLQEVSDALDVAYLSEKLRQSCLVLAHQRVYKAEYQIGMLDEVLQFVEHHQYLKIPAVAIYYYAYKAITETEEEEYFQKLKEQLFEHGDLFPHSEVRDIYLLALNYCIGRTNAGIQKYIRETFELYRHGLEKSFLLQNGVISRFTFRNVVNYGSFLKEFAWTKAFIDDYKEVLEEKYRENIVNYSQAKWHFEQKHYDKAMLLLAQMEYDDILMNLNAKTMLLKMYYELDEFDLLEALLESMRRYLRRKKILGYHKSNYNNIIGLTKKLISINPYNTQQRENLSREIEAAQPLTERKWLLAQLDVLVN